MPPDDTDNEINIIGGPFRFGFDTFQINSGAVKTFEEVNFANKKHVYVYGGDDTGTGKANDIITVYTPDGEAPDLLIDLFLFGGDVAAGSDLSDDYFVIRPSKDFPIEAAGGNHDSGDFVFLDCANTDSSCDPGDMAFGGYVQPAGMIAAGFEDITIATMEETALALGHNVSIRKELIGYASDGAHPGDDLQYRVTIRNDGADGTTLDLTATPIFITDVIDHRLSLVEGSILVEGGTVDIESNRSMLWRINDVTAFAAVSGATPPDSLSMTYTVIVNTLITTEDIHNYASILNDDGTTEQFDDGDPDDLEHFGHVDLELLDVFGFPLKTAINATLFFPTEAGPRYMVGLYGGAKDPSQVGLGAVLCRVPENQ